MKRIILVILALVTALQFCACSGGSADAGDAEKLSFRDAAGYDTLKEKDGKTVTINGYLATSSPADGSFLFLMNLPYQSCPFCVPNTSQLSNTMEVYPKKGETFGYTTQAVKVVGTLAVAEDPAKPFTDLYGYEFNFKIVDAEYFILSETELTADMQLWQRLAQTDVVNEIYSMYDYLNFLCRWDTYFVDNFTDENGVAHPGYYLYAADALNFLQKDGAQYNYGYKEGYFDAIVAKVESVDKDAFADLVSNIRSAEDLARRALAELENGNYTSEEQYVEKFGTTDTVYHLTNGEALAAENDAIYSAFAAWLAKWEF